MNPKGINYIDLPIYRITIMHKYFLLFLHKSNIFVLFIHFNLSLGTRIKTKISCIYSYVCSNIFYIKLAQFKDCFFFYIYYYLFVVANHKFIMIRLKFELYFQLVYLDIQH